jgi:hypothetical protein
MKTLVLFLEERSAKAFLEEFLPHILTDQWKLFCISFEGKQDLEKQLPRKLRNWQKPDTIFVVLRDKDSGDCIEIKNNLQQICAQESKSQSLVRIAVFEIESWYLGNLEAVEKGLRISGISRNQDKKTLS